MFQKKLTKDQLGELRTLHQLIRQEKYKLDTVVKNTALVKGHKQWVKTQTDIVKLLETQREDAINFYCSSMGIKGKVSIDLNNGKIYESRDE